MSPVTEGTLLWEPTEEFKNKTTLVRYMNWLKQNRGLAFSTYPELWQWSVDHLEEFWASVWDFFEVKASQPYTSVLSDHKMPGARWFEGSQLNYAEHLLRYKSERPAIVHQSELRQLGEVSWQELEQKTAALAATLRQLGVKPGDRVAAYMPNIPETVIAFLATASIGAIWSSVAPEFGTPSVISRFNQIEPTVLFAVDGYKYGGKAFDKMSVVKELQEALPTVQRTIVLPYLNEQPDASALRDVVMWQDALSTSAEELTFEQVDFDHPLWVLYSSGTTGLPKPIVQGHGGILMKHLVALPLQNDVKPTDRLFWFTTTGWMMWNFTLSGLLSGATIVLYDGNPAYPDLNVLWKLAQDSQMTAFGTSASFLTNCMKAGLEPGKQFDLSKLAMLAYTGSPLSPEGFEWVYQHVKSDLWLAPGSGGTDICSVIVGSSPLLPVRAGEMSCACLGVKAQSFSDDGQPVVGEVGELVITEPVPSMPLYFWNDPDGERYKSSYFEDFPGVWRHGDLIKFTERGSCVIYGRSDATINRFGVRIGSSEIYNAIESLPEVADSLVVDLSYLDRPSYMPLFVVLKPGQVLTDELKQKINWHIRDEISPRHVPNDIFAVSEVPRTLNGKKMEVPVRKILLGVPTQKAVNVDSMANPTSMEYFLEFAQTLNHGEAGN